MARNVAKCIDVLLTSIEICVQVDMDSAKRTTRLRNEKCDFMSCMKLYILDQNKKLETPVAYSLRKGFLARSPFQNVQNET